MAVQNIGRLAGPIIAITKAASAATELFETIDATLPSTSGLKEPEISADTNITFENVAFSYPSRPNVPILGGLDLQFEAGKVTAIVGPSGSGKSTVVGLVQRWYELLGTTAVSNAVSTANKTTKEAEATQEVPVKKSWFRKKSATSDERKHGASTNAAKDEKDKAKDDVVDLGPNTCTGMVKIGGTDLRDVDLKWWRSQIGLVQQEPFLFNDTLYNNIVFGLCGTQYQDLPKEEKMKMVEEACREAYAEEFISRLPEGYDTFVGESGIKLSGGQRQRIAIARSIIKQPPILILDEATSAIDVRTERIVQKALDRVSKNRTTIVIAHRLSTIRRADKIIVLRKGQLAEQGTHDELLKLEMGVYRGLVTAQELALEAEEEDVADSPLQKIATADTEQSIEPEQVRRTSVEDPEYKPTGIANSFGRLLYEQRRLWVLYSVAIVGILGAGAVYPIQAYVFAKIMNVFTYTGDRLRSDGNFYAGMFGVLAAGIGVAYFILGMAGHLISVSVTRHYRQEYLSNMIRKRISFFDDAGHSTGSLTSKLSSDCEQLQQLTGTEMSLAFIAIVNLIGSILIAFIYGWKLTLVGIFSAMPLILAAGYIRTRIEMQFEKDNAKVFENSSQFAAEAVGAFRTVLSLIMEESITNRYDELLKGHVKQSFHSAKFGTVVFAASDSVDLACMALTFWYGGTLLAKREYDIVKFFVVYMGVVFGAMAAGMWFSVAPNMAQATGAANRILSMRPTERHGEKQSLEPREMPGGVSIEFRNVDFTYKSREVPVLSNLNMKVEPGQFAALVGASVGLLQDPRVYNSIANDPPGLWQVHNNISTRTFLRRHQGYHSVQWSRHHHPLALVVSRPTQPSSARAHAVRRHDPREHCAFCRHGIRRRHRGSVSRRPDSRFHHFSPRKLQHASRAERHVSLRRPETTLVLGASAAT